jgi:hypothetical protein
VLSVVSSMAEVIDASSSPVVKLAVCINLVITTSPRSCPCPALPSHHCHRHVTVAVAVTVRTVRHYDCLFSLCGLLVLSFSVLSPSVCRLCLSPSVCRSVLSPSSILCPCRANSNCFVPPPCLSPSVSTPLFCPLWSLVLSVWSLVVLSAAAPLFCPWPLTSCCQSRRCCCHCHRSRRSPVVVKVILFRKPIL